MTGLSTLGIFVIIWAIIFPVFWKRREINLAKKWGQLRFDIKEPSRPEFKGTFQLSDVDGRNEEVFSWAKRAKRVFVGYSVAFCFV